LLLVGCGHEAIDFNNQVAGIHAQLEGAVEEFGRALKPAVDQDLPPTSDELAVAIESLRAALAAAKQRSDQLRVPDAPQARELYAAHQEFLAAQQSLLEEELVEIERLAGARLKAGELPKRLEQRFAAFKAEESRRLETLNAAQQRFAEANGLKLARVAE
jgi:hypothetical protein